MASITIVLGGKEHTIEEHYHQDNKKWRQKLEAKLGLVVDSVADGLETEVTQVTSIARTLQSVFHMALQSVDIASDMLLLYAPQLEDAYATAYDREIIDGFAEVLKTVYPFGSLLDWISSIGSKMPSPMKN